MKNKLQLYFVLLVSIACIYGKCKKTDVSVCNGSCYNIVGHAKDSISGVGIVNAGIEIATVLSGAFPYYTGSYGNGYTDNSGLFSLYYPSNNVDFNNNHLSITITPPIDYIADDIDLKNKQIAIYASDSPKINTPIIKNVSFLKKAYLNVRVTKSGSSVNSLYSFGYRFGRMGHGYVGTFPSANNTDTTYRFETAAEIKTYSNWQTKNGNVATNFADSSIIQTGQTKNILIQL